MAADPIVAHHAATLVARFEMTGAANREHVARELAVGAAPESMTAAATLLTHDSERVRLGAIEYLAAGLFRPALRVLVAVANQRRTDERVFAARAVVRLAGPEDAASLAAIAETWADDEDPFLAAQGKALIVKLGIPGDGSARAARALATVPPGATPTALTFGLTSTVRGTRREAIARTAELHPTPGDAFVEAMLATGHPGARLDLLAALEATGADALLQLAPTLLASPATDADLAALTARAVERALDAAPKVGLGDELPTTLLAAMRTARVRFEDSALVTQAVDHCLLVHMPQFRTGSPHGDPVTQELVGRFHALEPPVARSLAASLLADSRGRLQILGPLLRALGKAPSRLAWAATLFEDTLDTVTGPKRRGLALIARRLAAKPPGPRDATDGELAALGRLTADLWAGGNESAAPLWTALSRRDAEEPQDAAVHLAAAVASDTATGADLRFEALELLVTLARTAPPSVRAHARNRLTTLDVPGTTLVFDGEGRPTVTRAYRTPSGAALHLQGRVLRTADGDGWLLGATGTPEPEADAEWGGCGCCTPSRVLTRPQGHRPTCPVTGQSHLEGPDGGLVVERDHALGGCSVCRSLKPLMRDGESVRCPDCGQEHEQVAGRWVRKREVEPESKEIIPIFIGPNGPIGRPRDEHDAIPVAPTGPPTPPTRQEVARMPPAVRHAMDAHVFISGRAAQGEWRASGVIVAVDAGHVAVLTNWHVVDDDGVDALAREDLRVHTIFGEEVPARCTWIASGGEDLALLTCKLATTPDAPAQLRQAAPVAGDRLFAVGNPMGQSWTYTEGTLSAVRTWKTKTGRDVVLAQHQVPIAPGSSGGGLYRQDGALVGVNSFLSGSGFGASMSWAVAMESVLATLERDAVAWRDAPLLARHDPGAA